jgi:hypothetical protein
MMAEFLDKFSHISEYASLKSQLFEEYFDNRKYLLEVYLDAIASAYDK